MMQFLLRGAEIRLYWIKDPKSRQGDIGMEIGLAQIILNAETLQESIGSEFLKELPVHPEESALLQPGELLGAHILGGISAPTTFRLLL